MSPDTETRPPTRVVVIGLGLVGGSVARALKATDDPIWIGATSLEADDLARAESEGVVDRVFGDPGEAAGAADVVVYATPLDASLQLLDRHRDRWAPDAVVTDVVSVKRPLLERMRELGESARYVGSHPMAGSEETGFGASRADLFGDALTYLVRGDAERSDARIVEALWSRMGARTVWVDAGEHDRRMALASHLPQLLANALATVMARSGRTTEELGPGGRDMTRLASSPPALWRGLLRALAPDDAAALRALVDELDGLVALLDEERIEELVAYMERSRTWREEDGWS